MEKIVVSLGGSILDPDDREFLRRLSSMFLSASKKVKLYIVTGGGRVSRRYIEAGRTFGSDERFLDRMGIVATRLNAMLLISSIGTGVCPNPPSTYSRAIEMGKVHPIVVMGGTRPGHTTDAVCAVLAERVKASRLVNATNVDGVYDKDPARFANARKFESISFRELLDLLSGQERYAGPHVIFDIVGTRILARESIPLLVVHGNNLEDFRAAILGRKFRGTIVS